MIVRRNLALSVGLASGVALTVTGVGLVLGWGSAVRIVAWVFAIIFGLAAFGLVAWHARAKRQEGKYPPGGMLALTFFVWGLGAAIAVCVAVARGPETHSLPPQLISVLAVFSAACLLLATAVSAVAAARRRPTSQRVKSE